jgi:Kiwa KwaB-like protein
MTAAETFTALQEFLRANPPIELATVSRPAGRELQQEARYLPMEASAEAFFRRITTEAIIDSPNPDLRPLDPTYKPERGTIEWAELADVDAVRIAAETYASLSILSPFQPGDESYKRRLRFWVARREAQGERAFFFRAFSASAELKRKRGAAFVSHDGAFRRIEQHIFLFDENVDCVVFGGYLFVLRKADYRRIFDQLEQLRQAARAAAARLHARVPIANFEEFADACAKQPAMADKLIALEGRDYFARLSFEMLSPVIDEFQLGIEVEDREGVSHLVFESDPAHRWRILRLVDDDYLRSSMTDHRYEVNSKTATG